MASECRQGRAVGRCPMHALDQRLGQLTAMPTGINATMCNATPCTNAAAQNRRLPLCAAACAACLSPPTASHRPLQGSSERRNNGYEPPKLSSARRRAGRARLVIGITGGKNPKLEQGGTWARETGDLLAPACRECARAATQRCAVAAHAMRRGLSVPYACARVRGRGGRTVWQPSQACCTVMQRAALGCNALRCVATRRRCAARRTALRPTQATAAPTRRSSAHTR